MDIPAPHGKEIGVPEAIYRLTDRFSLHWEEYHQSYSEAQLRQDFIDPLFEALDWDVKNTRGRWARHAASSAYRSGPSGRRGIGMRRTWCERSCSKSTK